MRTAFQSGVTLIEVMVVLAIAAIMISLAIPGYTAWIADAQIRNGAESLGSGLRYAKAQAIFATSWFASCSIRPRAPAAGRCSSTDGAVLQPGLFIESA